jgi:hypothetical protein
MSSKKSTFKAGNTNTYFDITNVTDNHIIFHFKKKVKLRKNLNFLRQHSKQIGISHFGLQLCNFT